MVQGLRENPLNKGNGECNRTQDRLPAQQEPARETGACITLITRSVMLNHGYKNPQIWELFNQPMTKTSWRNNPYRVNQKKERKNVMTRIKISIVRFPVKDQVGVPCKRKAFAQNISVIIIFTADGARVGSSLLIRRHQPNLPLISTAPHR